MGDNTYRTAEPVITIPLLNSIIVIIPVIVESYSHKIMTLSGRVVASLKLMAK